MWVGGFCRCPYTYKRLHGHRQRNKQLLRCNVCVCVFPSIKKSRSLIRIITAIKIRQNEKELEEMVARLCVYIVFVLIYICVWIHIYIHVLVYVYFLNLPFWKTLSFLFSDNEKSASFLFCVVDICVVSNSNNNRSNNRIMLYWNFKFGGYLTDMTDC